MPGFPTKSELFANCWSRSFYMLDALPVAKLTAQKAERVIEISKM